jgi:hypothetical protein
MLKTVHPASLSFFSTSPSSTSDLSARCEEVVVDAARTFWGRVAAGAAVVVAIAGIILELRSTVETSDSERTRVEVEAILAARAPPSQADKLEVYVKRADLEEELRSFVREPIDNAGSFVIVVGPRGAGKSTLVSHVLHGMGKGTLVVPIDATVKASDLKNRVLDEALMRYGPQNESYYATSTPVDGKHLAERLEAAANARGEEGWRPTLVLEISQSGDGELIRSACVLLKHITHDRPLCHGILVLSSSFAVAELPNDRRRQRFLPVGAFSRDEASAYLDAKFTTNLSAKVANRAVVDAVKERFLQLTTLPKDVGDFTRVLLGSESEEDFSARAEAWMNKFEATARKDVKRTDTDALNIFIRNPAGTERCFIMRDLMRQLLNTGGPIELPEKAFDVPPEVFASAIRSSPAAKEVFHLDLVSLTVDFATGAHRKAAVELLSPPSPPVP